MRLPQPSSTWGGEDAFRDQIGGQCRHILTQRILVDLELLAKQADDLIEAARAIDFVEKGFGGAVAGLKLAAARQKHDGAVADMLDRGVVRQPQDRSRDNIHHQPRQACKNPEMR
jgi:hypothetical protein